MPTLVAYPYDVRDDFSLSDPTIESSGSAPTDLWDAVNAEDGTHWLDFEPVTNNVRTVFEFDMSALPVGAIPTGVQLEFCIERGGGSTSGLKVRSAAVDGNNNLILGPDERPIRGASGPPRLERLVQRRTLAKGELWSNYGNICAVVTNFGGSDLTGVQGHFCRLIWLRAIVEYAGAPPAAVSPSLSGTISVPTACGWRYEQEDGVPQTHYRVAISPGSDAVADPDAYTGWVFDTGKTQGATTRSVSLADDPLPNGNYRQYVKVWGRLSDGSIVQSAWVSSSFTVASAPTRPANPVITSVTPWGPNGGAVIAFTSAASASDPVQIDRSVDWGDSWQSITPVFDEGPPRTLTDFGVPIDVATQWRIRQVNAAGTAVSDWVTSISVTLDQSDLVATDPLDGRENTWWILVPADPELNLQPIVETYDQEEMRTSAVTVGYGGNAVTLSPNLGRRNQMAVYTRNRAERTRVEALLNSGHPFRLIDVFGDSGWFKLIGSVRKKPWRAAPHSGETTGLRDFHVLSFEVLEVREPGT